MNTDLILLEDLLKNHDWTHEMSDDNRYYMAGRNSVKAMKELFDKADEEGWKDKAVELFEKHKDKLASLNEHNYIVINFYGS